MKTELSAEYKGRNILIKNHWLEGCKVFLDGELIHHSEKFIHLDRDVPFFKFDLETPDGVESALLFVEAIMDVKLLLQISGKTISRTDIAA